MKNLTEMTKEDFFNLPHSDLWTNDDVGEFYSLVILPTEEFHESGYRCMDFVAVSEDKMIRVAGTSDVLHINGISGSGKNLKDKITPINWSIDCLPKSGLLQLFCHKKLTVGEALSSFQVFAEEK